MRTILERFEAKFIKTGTCWLWTGATGHFGYGRFYIKKARTASRVSYELYKGEIPKGMLVCHSCDVPACVNPEHLWLGTHKDNTKDMWDKNRFGVAPPQKITIEEVLCIRRHAEQGLHYAMICKMFDISTVTYYNIKHKRMNYNFE